jgi:muramoyltetrapeptide carboxypeptidase
MIPDRLSPNDTIGIAAPSDPVQPELEDRLQAGIDILKSLGFRVKPGQYLHSQALGYAATPEQKAEDLNNLFADPKVKAIICTQGGDTANAPLALLDWDMIKQNPKIFLGLSDITVLLNAITHKTGLVTFHGNDILWGFGNNMTDYEQQEFERILVKGKTGLIPPNRPRKTIRSGTATGKLLGGNLRCLLKLAGTPYWPDFTDAILFVEAYEISPKACHAAFHQLHQMGLFDRITGAIVGYIDSMQRDDSPGPYMEDVLLEVTQTYSFPTLKINDFGHNCPNTVLPVGGQVRIDADNQIIEIVSPCVG